jgi:hypothetical protein
MDQFRTKVNIPVSPANISYLSKCLLMGSCFSDYIGQIMKRHKFQAVLNPFGTLFNPASIAQNTEHLLSGNIFTAGELHQHNGLWFSFFHYTGFSDPHPQVCLEKINTAAKTASAWLKTCDYLILTFGTAWIYKYNATSAIVANCHKLPAAAFTRSLMQPGEIIALYRNLIPLLRSVNPGLRIIFTLSPVRHWADGAENNLLSKSILHYSIHEILKEHAELYYFPAYEIFMDELRDYRFYAADMLHPSEQGTAYIWQRFCDTWMDPATLQQYSNVSAVIRATGHRPMNAVTDAHKTFRQQTLEKIEHLSRQFPFMDFSEEIASLQR